MIINGKTGRLIGVKQFDYIFMDDVGEGNTAESSVSACLLKPGGCLVLCEDFDQLSLAYSRTIWDERLGNSLLQRLAKFNIYQLDPTIASYNGDYV